MKYFRTKVLRSYVERASSSLSCIDSARHDLRYVVTLRNWKPVFESMIGENRQSVTDELVEFEK